MMLKTTINPSKQMQQSGTEWIQDKAQLGGKGEPLATVQAI